MASAAESGRIVVAGASLEWAAWGKRGRPGVLLLIGNGAHIGWWRPIAPLLAEYYRVAAFNWSGMGSSDWRETYPIETFTDEAMAVAQATGLFDGHLRPILAAHSLGGFLGMETLIRHGTRFRGAMLIDSRLRIRSAWGAKAPHVPAFRIYPSREQAISRFRLKPDQTQHNPFILHMLATESIEAVADGWRWRADPDFRRKTELGTDLIPLIGHVPCPLMFVRGEHSSSVTSEIWDEQRAAAPAKTPFVEIPDAHHHVMLDQPIALLSVMRALFSALPEHGRWDR